jgi:hypothetical protein
LQRAAAEECNNLAVSSILANNSRRIEMRIKRFAEARPTVPGQVWVLLLATVATTIGGLAALGHPGVRRRVQLAVLFGTTAVIALTLLIMHDLDRPFDGLVRIAPTAMLDVTRRISALPSAAIAPPRGAADPSPAVRARSCARASERFVGVPLPGPRNGRLRCDNLGVAPCGVSEW